MHHGQTRGKQKTHDPLAADPLDPLTVLTQTSQAIDVLTSWMAANRLLLNPSKAQAIWLGGHRQLAKIDGQRLSYLFPHITFSTCLRDLGAMLDTELTFSHHINLIARKTMLLSATSASGRFPISPPPIQTHPCPRICNQPY